ncbi:hypothetical protein IMC64_003796 [Escherichia coli]|nr:hypothetical protein [Escherichia coli]EGL8746551.1 hypothetical protein [Escherichia coli]
MLASLGGLVSCAAKVHFKEAGNAMNELIANHDFDFRQLVTAAEGQPVTDTFQIPGYRWRTHHRTDLS